MKETTPKLVPRNQIDKLYKLASHERLQFDESHIGMHIWTDDTPLIKNDKTILFAMCLVLPGSNKASLRCKQVFPSDATEATFYVSTKSAWQVNHETNHLTIRDIGMLPYSNIPCVLHYCHERFRNDLIYSTADPLLIAINPFRFLNNTEDDTISKYKDVSDVGDLPAHIFTVARQALDNLHSVGKSQCIIVSGESGAGKTEATKQMMRFFACVHGSSKHSKLQNAILAASPVLEAFGNAKTVRNDNSSRFGKFMQFDIGPETGISHGLVRCFLLEKSRVVFQGVEDRNYHIFYQLLKGSSSELREKLNLRKLKDYKILNKGSVDCPQIDDKADFAVVTDALLKMGLSEEERFTVFSILSGILELGNINPITVTRSGVHDAAAFDGKTRVALANCCKLLYLDARAVENALTNKTTFAGNQVVEGVWSIQESEMLKDSLAKAMYDRLFHWLIGRLNQLIAPPAPLTTFMAMLDIFGFEIFAVNSLEQLFINITNERLQRNFVDVVFSRENKLYKEEGISSIDLEYTDNEALIESLCGRSNSILTFLEDQCLAPSGCDRNIVVMIQAAMSPTSNKRQKSAPNQFIINHTVGDILYTSDNFVSKNKDVLRPELLDVLTTSSSNVVQELFKNIEVSKGKIGKGVLIGSQFASQLDDLMKIIDTTEPHFVRCIKPNENKEPKGWEATKVLMQLHSLSVLEALQLKGLGFSYRRPFDEFVHQFRHINLSVATNANLDVRSKCGFLLAESSIPENDYRFGKTMLFMAAEPVQKLHEKQRLMLARWTPIVKILEAAFKRRKARQAVKALEDGLVVLQQHLLRHAIIDEVEKSKEKKMSLGESLQGLVLDNPGVFAAEWLGA